MNHWLFLDPATDSVRCMHWARAQGEEWEQGEGEPTVLSLHGHDSALKSRVTVVMPATKVLLTDVVLPPNVSPDEQTLAFALEDRLFKDPAELSITRLSKIETSRSAGEKVRHSVAIIDRTLLNQIHLYLQSLGVERYTLTTDALLIPVYPQQWTLWMSPAGAVIRFSEFLGMGLMPGMESFVLQRQMKDCISENRAPKSITLMLPEGHPEQESLAIKQLQSWGINTPIIFQTMTLSTLLNAPPISILPTPSSWLHQGKRWLKPLMRLPPPMRRPLYAILLLSLFLGLWQMGKMYREQQRLMQTIDENFYRIFPREAVKSPRPLEQMEEHLRRAQGGSMRGDQKFTPLMLGIIEAFKQSPTSKPTSINYDQGVMTIKLGAQISSATLAQLQQRWTQANIVSEGATLTLSFRTP